MSLTVALILVLAFIIIFIILIEIYTILFRVTGLTNEKARFQVVSLLTNSGFTTSESEIITSSPRRRKIAIATMITGHAFSVIIVSLAVTVLLTISSVVNEIQSHYIAILISLGVFLLLLILLKVPFIAKPFSKLIEKIAIKSLERRDSLNVITELDNYGKSSIVEILIRDMPKILVDKPLSETNLKGDYSINLLIVKRKNKILEVTGDTILQSGDVIAVFGPMQNIKELFMKSKKKDLILEKNEESKVNEITIIDNYGKEAMVEVLVNNLPDFLKDKPLSETNLKSKFDINVIMIKRGGTPLEVSKDTVIQTHDIVVVFGSYSKIKDVFLKMAI